MLYTASEALYKGAGPDCSKARYEGAFSLLFVVSVLATQRPYTQVLILIVQKPYTKVLVLIVQKPYTKVLVLIT